MDEKLEIERMLEMDKAEKWKGSRNDRNDPRCSKCYFFYRRRKACRARVEIVLVFHHNLSQQSLFRILFHHTRLHDPYFLFQPYFFQKLNFVSIQNFMVDLLLIMFLIQTSLV